MCPPRAALYRAADDVRCGCADEIRTYPEALPIRGILLGARRGLCQTCARLERSFTVTRDGQVACGGHCTLAVCCNDAEREAASDAPRAGRGGVRAWLTSARLSIDGPPRCLPALDPCLASWKQNTHTHRQYCGAYDHVERQPERAQKYRDETKFRKSCRSSQKKKKKHLINELTLTSPKP